VLVVASDPVVRRALVTSVQQRGEDVQVEGRSSLDTDNLPPCDAVLWDLGADRDGVAERFDGTTMPDVPVVALVPVSTWSRAAFSWGAAGVLPRDADDGVIDAALRATGAGLRVFGPTLTEALLTHDDATRLPVAPSDTSLTEREREVLGLIAEGMPNKLIAHRLGISEHTVKFHVNAVMTRLGAQSRTEAVVRAARLGMLVL
jgi:DNA-binding NarL/FixJ family response regulator